MSDEIDEDVADDPNGPVPLESEIPQVLGSQSVDWTPVIAFIASLEVTRKVILRSVPAFEVLRGFGAVFRKRKDPQKLYELSRQCQSIEEFWSHSRSETFIYNLYFHPDPGGEYPIWQIFLKWVETNIDVGNHINHTWILIMGSECFETLRGLFTSWLRYMSP